MKKKILAFILCGLLVSLGTRGASADEIDDLNNELGKLQQQLEASRKASKPLETDLARMRQQLSSIKSRLAGIQASIAREERALEIADRDLVKQKTIIDQRVAAHYKNLRKTGGSMLDLLVAQNFSASLKNLFYQKTAADNDRQTILKTVLYINTVETAKKKLASEKVLLAKTQVQVDADSRFLEGELGKAKSYQSELSSKIAQLNAKQKQLIAQKLGGLNLPTSLGFGALSCTDDRKLDPGFSPAIAFFTFGIPHRIGMNQYGALGRAKNGQNVEQILDAYFDNVELKKDYSTDITIQVKGYGGYQLEEYVKRIYEMPESWPLEALKAQAILARSYALAYTGNGAREICTTQSCQVFKPDPKSGAWAQAVDETRGWVLTQDGNPITAWYSSTDGGYTFQSSDVGWSPRSYTKRLQDGSAGYSSWDDLFNNAYDKDSPCFYAAQGWRSEYGKSAWLRPSEVADIVNAILLAQKDSSVQDKLYQPDKPHPYGGETWGADRVKEELRARGGNPFNSISDASVSADFGVGRTNSITLSGDAGSVTFSGSEFKDFFNLRAPANIQIVGGLYRTEKR